MKKQPQDLLTIDIIDYIIDNGCPKIINLIALDIGKAADILTAPV